MAESRNSWASRGISDHAEGVELINKDLLIMAKFSPNINPGQPEVVDYNSDMAVEEMDETLYSEQFGNTYEAFDGSFPNMTDEEMVEARYEEQFGNNRYEKIATASLNQPSDPTMLGESKDSFPKVRVPNRDKDECGCSICLGYYRDKNDCGCSICLEYHRDKYDCRCSICLEYYYGTDKAFSRSRGTAASNSSSSFILVSDPTEFESHAERQVTSKYVLPVNDTYYTILQTS